MNTKEKRALIAQRAAELKRLNEEVANEERTCQHDWSNPAYDPDTKLEGTFDHYEPHGSDPEPIYNYHEVKVDRWSRTCKKCGKKEYTKKQKSVATAPDFGRD